MIVDRLRSIPGSYGVSTKNGCKSVLLRNVNRINPNRLQLKRLIPIEHNPSYVMLPKRDKLLEKPLREVELLQNLLDTPVLVAVSSMAESFSIILSHFFT